MNESPFTVTNNEKKLLLALRYVSDERSDLSNTSVNIIDIDKQVELAQITTHLQSSYAEDVMRIGHILTAVSMLPRESTDYQVLRSLPDQAIVKCNFPNQWTLIAYCQNKNSHIKAFLCLSDTLLINVYKEFKTAKGVSKFILSVNNTTVNEQKGYLVDTIKKEYIDNFQRYPWRLNDTEEGKQIILMTLENWEKHPNLPCATDYILPSYRNT